MFEKNLQKKTVNGGKDTTMTAAAAAAAAVFEKTADYSV